MREVEHTSREPLRRDLLRGLFGLAVLGPTVIACVESSPTAKTASGADVLPLSKPKGWEPLSFNRERGNRGFVPEGYRPQINGKDGDLQHLGKHLPYVPVAIGEQPSAEWLPLMWGDPAKGHARHPQTESHHFDWIRLRKATEAEAYEVESRFTAWPSAAATDSGKYTGQEGKDPTALQGKNTVYLVRLPGDVRPGDTVRVHAHCSTHGEYVDFLTVPVPA